MPTAPKWLKVQTLNLARMLPVKVHDPWKKFSTDSLELKKPTLVLCQNSQILVTMG